MDRIERVNSLLKEAISLIVQRKLKDPRLGMVSIHDVIVSRDLRTAKVFFGVLNPDDKNASQEALDSASSFIRKELGQEVILRYIPKLSFIYDDTLEKSERIFQLLRSIKKSDIS